MILQRAFENGQDMTLPAQLYVLACVSPSAYDCEDTVNTLNYITPFRVRVHCLLLTYVGVIEVLSVERKKCY
jgi:hypothetical protein